MTQEYIERVFALAMCLAGLSIGQSIARILEALG